MALSTVNDAGALRSPRSAHRSVVLNLRKSLKPRLSSTLGLWIPLLYVAVMLPLSSFHHTFSEWGGVMQYFSGQEILSGAGYQGWASHFWPPMFSLLLGLGSRVVPGFLAGKAISILSASALLVVTFYLAQELFASRRIGLWSQAFLAVSPVYVFESLLAHNHMLDALFFGTGLYLFLHSFNRLRAGRLFLAGLVCGLAGLSRYTSYVLLVLPFFLWMFEPSLRLFARLAASFWLGFAVVSLPWWYVNAVLNGSPIYTWQHLNLCSSIIAQNPGTNHALWWCADQLIPGIAGIFTHYPASYVMNTLRNSVECGKLLIAYGGAAAPFVIPAMLEGAFLVEPKRWIVVAGVLGVSVFLVSQAFVNEWYLLGWVALVTVVTAAFVSRYLSRMTERFPRLNTYHFHNVAMVFLLVAGLTLTTRRLVGSFAAFQQDYTPLADVFEVSRALKEHDPALASKVVMAVDPARAYYAGTKFLMTPVDYEGTVAGLVSYDGISEQLRNYAPRYPSNMAGSELKADYLVYTKTPPVLLGEQDQPQFSFLLDPRSERIPSNFHLVYGSPNVVVYEVER